MSNRRGRTRYEGRAESWFEGLEEPKDRSFPDNGANSVDDVVGQIGLVLVIILGGVFAINLVLIALHIQ